MSILIRGTPLQESGSYSHSSSSEDDEDEDETWDDWVSDAAANNTCKSLFDNDVFPSAADALRSDKSKYNFDLDEICGKLGETSLFIYFFEKMSPCLTSGAALDFHGRTRLINYIRKEVGINNIAVILHKRLMENIETTSYPDSFNHR
jgi:type I protein arginine methyltransferase